MRRLLLPAAMVVLASCTSSEDFTPTAPSPDNTVPSIGGTYTSATFWRIELTTPEQVLNTFICNGTVTITNQIGDNFSGSFLILDPACGAAFRGAVVNGVLQRDGSITFELAFSDGTTNFVTGAFDGCTYVSGATGMTGTLNGNALQAEARTELDCVPDGRVSQLIRITGSR
jgi:hypothetical protein